MNKHSHIKYDYDVTLSFAGEDRPYVEKVAAFLRQAGVKVFYDTYEKTNLWGKDLYQHLDKVYQKTSRYAIVFISKHYAKKLWTNHELKSAQARAFNENEEYILPARFDQTEIPGIRPTVGYIDLKNTKPNDFAKLIIKKLEEFRPENVLPWNRIRLKQFVTAEYQNIDPNEIDFIAHNIFNTLKLLSAKEKFVIGKILFEGCQHNLPEDIHIDLKVLERHTKLSSEEIVSCLNNSSDLGFDYSVKKSTHGKKSKGNIHKLNMLSLRLEPLDTTIGYENIILFLVRMVNSAFEGYCYECSFDSFVRLDFSGLSQRMTKREVAELKEIFNTE